MDDSQGMTTEKIKDVGFCIQRKRFTTEEVRLINERIVSYASSPRPGIVYEEGSKIIRGIHGPHLHDEFFFNLICDPRLLHPAEHFLGECCYVHQLKINMKQRMSGEAWPWHQDFIYWKNGDDIENSNLLNVAILLDDVETLHGPMCFIPKSHQFGDLTQPIINGGGWEQDLSKNLTYQIGHETIDRLIRDAGVEYISGEAGDMVLFDPQLAHCSSTNLSPRDRVLLIVTYNAVSNAPQPKHGRRRPEFLSARDFSPLEPKALNNYMTNEVV